MWSNRRRHPACSAGLRRPAGVRVALLLAAIGALALDARSAAAEWYADLYGGIAFTQSHDVFENAANGNQQLGHTFLNVSVEDSPVYGGRIGRWTDDLPWLGFGLDVFHFNPDLPKQASTIAVATVVVPDTFQDVELSVTAIAFDLLRLRYPLFPSAEYPNGRLQPYFAGGPALFITNVTDAGHFTPNGQSHTLTPLGAKISAGLTWHITPLIGIFGEYRFTYFNVTPVFTSTSPPATAVPQTSTFYSHHLLGGISLAF
jgi:Outer membrane protein beta-barrel domain